jgi:DNA-binding winged helix-turn-helix (wHTH) protein
MRFRFGDCVLDSETHELLREGRGVRVSPKAFQLLSVLIEKRPKALSKNELHAVLWPKTFVADTTLTGLVKELRAAIADDARTPQFIRTIPAFGYAFSGEGRELRRTLSSGFQCRVIGPDGQAGLAEGDNILGRGPGSVLWIDEDTVSRSHARICVGKEGAMLEDLSSKNGTFLGERRIDSPAVLRDGDQIRLGSFGLQFRSSGSPDSTRSAKSSRPPAGKVL